MRSVCSLVFLEVKGQLCSDVCSIAVIEPAARDVASIADRTVSGQTARHVRSDACCCGAASARLRRVRGRGRGAVRALQSHGVLQQEMPEEALEQGGAQVPVLLAGGARGRRG